ncbi:helix-turn-helix domain-containing protein [Allosalinactinospora lopnorensis]|uniref:helix-turn-helix domain-containing protein n=1 Tax=Allosalinactinospora lopnorensis TaxID=1352348 RepID=UPI000623CB0F|nr:helix-turn-helix transcriptional regulator [Allosalinactinospora lopnorensis]
MSPVENIGKRVKQVRLRQDMTAEDVARELRKQGVPWERATVAKLENGHRASITVTEWLALAYVLSVSPLHILVPLDDDAPFRLTPNREISALGARRFIRGFHHLPGMDWRAFLTEVPDSEVIVSEGKTGEWTIRPAEEDDEIAGR